jgi:hypothetical protein
MFATYAVCLLAGASAAVGGAIPRVRRQYTPSATVSLDYATYQGIRLPAGVDQYLGMRYAAAPVGDLRFRGPKDPETVSGVQNASSVSAIFPAFPPPSPRHPWGGGADAISVPGLG